MFTIANEYNLLREKKELSDKLSSQYSQNQIININFNYRKIMLGKIADVIIQIGVKLKDFTEKEKTQEYLLNTSQWEQNCS